MQRIFDTKLLPTIESERLTLRRLRFDDADQLFALHRDRATLRFSPPPEWLDELTTADWIKHTHRGFANQTFFVWGVVLRSSNCLVGTASLFDYHPIHRFISVSALMPPTDWACGHVAETIRTMTDLALGPMQMHRVEAETDARDAEAMALLTELGFHREGQLREKVKIDDAWYDSVLFSMLRQEWSQTTR